MDGRIPPQNLEAEVSVLGAMMLDKQAVVKIMEVISPDDFYRDIHKEIYNAMLFLYDRGEPVDLVTLANELRKGGNLERIGGATYLTSLLDSVPTAANVIHYAKIVKEKSLLRSLINVSNQIVHMGYEEESADATLDKAESMLFSIAEKRVGKGFVPIKQLIKDSFEYIEQLMP